MKIRSIELFTVRIPLPHTVWLGDVKIASREFCIAIVTAEDGLRGWGYTLTRNTPVAKVTRESLLPLVLGADADNIEETWQGLTTAAAKHATPGVASRGVSILDIALWDLKARRADLPLYRLLGGGAEKVRLVVPAGYRRDGGDPAAIVQEIRECAAAGITTVKLMFTPDELWERRGDLARIRAVSEETGLVVGNDFHDYGTDAATVLDRMRTADAGWFAFLEDPFALGQWPDFEELAANYRGEIFAGETVHTLESARFLAGHSWLGRARWDATVCGGVTAWRKMRAISDGRHAVVPHCFPEVHAHLVANSGDALVESSVPAYETINFAAVLDRPLPIADGHYHLPERSGLGFELNLTALKKLSMETT